MSVIGLQTHGTQSTHDGGWVRLSAGSGDATLCYIEYGHI